MADEPAEFQRTYSENSFCEKMKRFSFAAGRGVVEHALILSSITLCLNPMYLRGPRLQLPYKKDSFVLNLTH